MRLIRSLWDVGIIFYVFHNMKNLLSYQVNFILFICIIRILRQKINCPDIGRNESNQYLCVHLVLILSKYMELFMRMSEKAYRLFCCFWRRQLCIRQTLADLQRQTKITLSKLIQNGFVRSTFKFYLFICGFEQSGWGRDYRTFWNAENALQMWPLLGAALTAKQHSVCLSDFFSCDVEHLIQQP